MSRKSEIRTEIDKKIGTKIKCLRLARGWSRNQLSKEINVTGQQIAKYEDGSNRISVGMLYILAKTLNTTIGLLFKDLETSILASPMRERGALELVRYFAAIENEAQQNALLILAKSLVPKIETVDCKTI